MYIRAGDDNSFSGSYLVSENRRCNLLGDPRVSNGLSTVTVLSKRITVDT